MADEDLDRCLSDHRQQFNELGRLEVDSHGRLAEHSEFMDSLGIPLALVADDHDVLGDRFSNVRNSSSSSSSWRRG